MPTVAIPDASCLIILSKISSLTLLEKCYDGTYITPSILAEWNEPLPKWMTLRSPSITSINRFASLMLDTGEKSAVALASEFADCVLIIDEKKARAIAKSLSFAVTGTLGLLIRAKEMGLIDSLREAIDRIEPTNFYLRPELIAKALRIVGE